jgi:AraC-like DNA-binding protein
MRLNRANLAAKLGVGENTLARVMNSYLGKSFNELINSRRIEDAKLLLVKENMSIATIAADVGFNSTPSFNRVFRETVGTSPTQFRQAHL